MGLFSTIHAHARCGTCGELWDAEIQFKYGNLWTHEYGRGSHIVWGRTQVGDPSEVAVVADGIAGCPSCEAEVSFDITIRGGVICAVAVHDDAVDYHHGEGSYVVLKA